MNSTDILELLKKDLNKIEIILRKSIKSEVITSQQISSHIVLKAGKRFRPILLLLSYLVFKKRSNLNVINAAAAVEILHNASLLHDDIVDNSSMRRGQKTSNLIWGDHASVLAGDFLLSKSLWLINQTKSQLVMDSVTNAASELANGQIMDLTLSKSFDDFSIKNYFKMISLKTGSLLSSCSEVGAILAQANKKEITSMKDFGKNLGISFQIVDDLLDFIGVSESLGKKTMQDLKDGKVTLPLIIAVNSTTITNRKKAKIILKNRKFDRKSMDFLYNLIIREGALEKTKKEAEKYSRKAIGNMKCLDESVYKIALEFLLIGNLTRIN
jgi:octaprenyl-diphosphate synthase|tara:strand:- start:74418 stop:75398 length:981 start_codon:yes stop_codon:yes gene_type:complete